MQSNIVCALYSFGYKLFILKTQMIMLSIILG